MRRRRQNNLLSISSTFYARVFRTKFWRQSRNVTRKRTFVRKKHAKNVDEIDTYLAKFVFSPTGCSEFCKNTKFGIFSSSQGLILLMWHFIFKNNCFKTVCLYIDLCYELWNKLIIKKVSCEALFCYLKHDFLLPKTLKLDFKTEKLFRVYATFLRKQSEFLEIAVAPIFEVKRPSRYSFSRLNPPHESFLVWQTQISTMVKLCGDK